MPASQPQAITDVAKPVMVRQAISAHLRVGAGHDHASRGHVEGLGEAVVDADAVDDHVRHGSALKMSRSPKAAAGTAKAAGPTPKRSVM